ncbi:hypothetical protein HRbin34_00028 [bacterium HR34]|nr:hypothetical protein HRbin34_00028 [bacterium HR34]
MMNFLKNNKGFTLTDVLIGITLLSIALIAISGLVYFTIKSTFYVANYVTATNIAIEEIEKIRNLNYLDVGTVGAVLPFAQGILEPQSTVIRNGVSYTVERKIKFVSDPADGVGASDECDLDYKKVDIIVSFSGIISGKRVLSTIVSPDDLVEEIQSCTNQPGGILSVLVFDAQGIPVESPVISVYNPSTGNLIDQATPTDGSYAFILSPGQYKVVATKGGYSTDRTYGTDEITQPEKPHPNVIDGEITNISFSIDKLSKFTVYTLFPASIDSFSDSFGDFSKISNYNNVVLDNGQVKLLNTGSGYVSDGFIESVEIEPGSFLSWLNFTFNDNQISGTSIKYYVYYFDGAHWSLVPDSDLPGNSTGFSVSPVDLSSLDVATYSKLKFRADLHTDDTSKTPSIDLWQVSWKVSNETPAGNITFNVRGDKIIGRNSSDQPVYKFSQDFTSNGSGIAYIDDIEWDNYTFSSVGADPDLVATNPSTQPIFLQPNTNLEVKLYFESQNSLIVLVKDQDTLEPVQVASVRLYDGASYDKTNYTDSNGKTAFIPLETKNYFIEVGAINYSSYSGTVTITGDNTLEVFLQRIE